MPYHRDMAKIIYVYHGSTADRTKKILKNGFNISKSGSGWGSTYGEGIYFSFDPLVAKTYSHDEDIIVEAKIVCIPYYLNKEYKANCRKDQRLLKEQKQNAIKLGYTCFINKNRDEIILFDTSNIISTCSYQIYKEMHE
jgi:hypothetical protein